MDAAQAGAPYPHVVGVHEVVDRWLRLFTADVVVAALMTVTTVLGAIGESYPRQPIDKVSHGHLTPVAPWPAYFLVAVAGVVLVWRHRRPVAVLVASGSAVLLYTALGYVNGAALLDPVVALYAVAATARTPPTPGGVATTRRALIAAAATLVALMSVTAAFNPFGTFGGGFDLIPGLVAAALFAGLATANRRAYVQAMQQRAEVAERTREEEARRRVDAERLRIARELHDVVAHTMATINVQAGVAAHVSRDLPEPVANALALIRDASKNGLRELRAILAVLRQVDDTEPTAPTPTLDQLDTLVATARSAGLPTTLTICGTRRTLTADVELTAYRIVQESLTNAIRHAGSATAAVQLNFGEQQLDIDVIDTGAGTVSSSDGPGHGLVGMRERAIAVGGTLDAGPRRDGGFRVEAHLPVGSPS
jgi:signal transduction histidine kinase